MVVFIDESGDSGWKLNLQYRTSGGSSKYFIYSFLFIPTNKKGITKRVIKGFNKKSGVVHGQEIKGSNLSSSSRQKFCASTLRILKHNKDVQIQVVVLEKAKVPENLRKDAFALLEGQMLHLGVTNKTKGLEKITIIPDEKNKKTERKLSHPDILKNRIWFDLKNYIPLTYIPSDSKSNYNIVFIDWISNIVFRHFEFQDSEAFKLLYPHINVVEVEF